MSNSSQSEPAGSPGTLAVETEGKWRLPTSPEVARVRSKLQELGAERLAYEHERNDLFDLPDRSLNDSGRLLRIRVIDGEP